MPGTFVPAPPDSCPVSILTGSLMAYAVPANANSDASAVTTTRLIRVLLFADVLLQVRIHTVGDVQLAFRADGDKVRFAKLTGALARFAGGRQHVSLQVESQHLRGEAVDHVDIVAPDLEGTRHPGILHLANEGAVGIEHLN